MHINFLDCNHAHGIGKALESLGHRVSYEIAGDADIVIVQNVSDLYRQPNERRCTSKADVLWMREAPKQGTAIKIAGETIFAPSEFLSDYLVSQGLRSVLLAPDGINLPVLTEDARHPHRVLSTESPERGLFNLLDVWPYVLEQVPDAELHVLATFEAWERTMPDDVHRYLAAQLRERVLNTKGVKFLGREAMPIEIEISMQCAGIWAHLTSYPEVSCPNAMLAQACGCRVVSTTLGSIAEVVGRRGLLVPGDVMNQATRGGMVRALVHAMTDTKFDRGSVSSYAREHFSWETVAREHWVPAFESLLRP